TVTSTGAAKITLTGDSIDITSSSAITAGSNLVTLQPKTAGTAINVGGADAAGTLGLTDAELDRVTAGTLVVGRNDAGNAAGNITLTAAISPANTNTLLLVTGGAVIDGNTTGADLTVTSLAISANTGIGASNDPLDTAVSNLEAQTSTGGIFVSNTGNLTI